MRLLARRLGLDHPALQETDEEIAASVLPAGIDLQSLKAQGWYKSSPTRPAFDPARRLRLSGDVPLPPEPPNAGMLQLLTPKSHHFLNSSFANMPRQRKAMRRPTLEIHPRDADARGVRDGTLVDVRNVRGQLRVRVRVTDDVHPGVVVLPGKWWGFPDEASALVNFLTPSAWSPGGQPAYNDTFVDVTAVNEELRSASS